MTTQETDVKAVVRQKYGEAAKRVSEGAAGGCCGPVSSCSCLWRWMVIHGIPPGR